MNITDTTPLADMLAHLNTLRVANGKKELSSWKNSRLELELRIQQETPPAAAAPVAAPAPDVAKVAEVIAADVPVTKVAATAPELTKPAKRKAAIDTMVTKAVDTDTPTTVIDVKKASKGLPKLKTSKKEFNDMLEAGLKKSKKDKPAKQKPSTPQGKGEFALYLESIGMEGRVARAKLRRAKIKPVDGRYPLTDAVKAALASDGRKKDK